MNISTGTRIICSNTLTVNDAVLYTVFGQIKVGGEWRDSRTWCQTWRTLDDPENNPWKKAYAWITEFGILFDGYRVFDQDGVIWKCGETW